MTSRARTKVPPVGQRVIGRDISLDEWWAEIDAIKEEILSRRNGVPIDVDAIIDEMRGRTDPADETD